MNRDFKEFLDTFDVVAVGSNSAEYVAYKASKIVVAS
jgi:hypothetical protein